MPNKDKAKPQRKPFVVQPDPVRVKAEEATATAEQTKANPPAEITLEMVYAQNQQILDQQAWIIRKLQKRP